MKHIFVLLLVFSLVSVNFLFSTGVKEEIPQDIVQVNVAGLKGPSGLGMAALMKEGIAPVPGYAVSFEVAGSPDILVSKLLSGEVSAAALPLNVAAKLYAKGAPYILGAVSGYGSIYVVSADPSVKNLSDLRGKTVYNAGRGATPDFLFRYLAGKAGLNPETDLTLNFTAEHTELAQLLIAGKAETAVLPEPFVTMVLAKNPKLGIVLDLQKEWSLLVGGSEDGEGGSVSYPITAFVVGRDLAEREPAMVEALLTGLADSIAWVIEHPAEAGKISEELGIGFPAALAAAAVPRLNLVYLGAQEARVGVERFLEVFLSYDPVSIGERMPDEGFYYKPPR